MSQTLKNSLFMKKFLILFGILYLIAVGRLINPMISSMTNGSLLNWVNISMTILFVVMLLSGILLILSKKSGLWIYYVQFPFRLSYYAGLSFGFVMLIEKLFQENKFISFGLFVFALILEITRLVITIFIHKKYYSNQDNSSIKVTPD